MDNAQDVIARARPEALAAIFNQEHPQLAAVLLGSLEPEKASAILVALPYSTRLKLVQRLAGTQPVELVRMRELEALLAASLRAVDEQTVQVGGVDAAARLVAGLDAASRLELLAELEEDDAALAMEMESRLADWDAAGEEAV